MSHLDRSVRPNVLSAPGEVAARERAEAIFRRLDELGSLRGQALVIPSRDLDDREVALTRLERVADLHGRGPLLDQALTAVRETLLVREASPGIEGPYGIDIRGTHRIEDEVAMLAAIEDAVAVAITEDLLEPADAITLSTPGRRMLGVPDIDLGVTDAMIAGGAATRDEVVETDGRLTWDDSARDRAAIEGDDEATDAVDEEAELEAAAERRSRRAAVFVIIAALAIPAALSTGAASSLPLLVVIVAAAGLLAWLFG